MLIDWMTLRYELRSADDIALLNRASEGRDYCQKIRGGEVVSYWFPREKTSDTHKITVGLSPGAITVSGSPARLSNDCNVFGSSDPRKCFKAMLAAAEALLNVRLPKAAAWSCTRLDLTQNYDCGAHVKESLDALRHVAGGHIKVSTKNAGVYWNEKSDLWKAVAYLKGPHLQKQVRAGKAKASKANISLAQRLLRFELRLGSKFLKRTGLNVAEMTGKEAAEIYKRFAEKIMPKDISVTTEQQLANLIIETYGPRQGRSLLGTWGLIQSIGPEGAQQRMSRNLWYKHQKLLGHLGIGKADLHARKIVEFRPRPVVARPVDSWEELRRAA